MSPGEREQARLVKEEGHADYSDRAEEHARFHALLRSGRRWEWCSGRLRGRRRPRV